MDIVVGKTYNINHSRKGKFIGRIVKFDNTWTTIEIVDGSASAIREYNVAGKGQELTIRISNATFTAV